MIWKIVLMISLSHTAWIDMNVNGSTASIKEFPYIVSLQNIISETNSTHSCAGTIISEYWVLTAAFCIAVRKGSKTTLLLKQYFSN